MRLRNVLTLKVSDSTFAELDVRAAERAITRSQFTRELIEQGLGKTAVTEPVTAAILSVVLEIRDWLETH